MIIANVPDGKGGSFPVAVQGSCRVFGPFKSILQQQKLDVLYEGATPFTFTPGAARQYFDFCCGRVEVPEFLWPFVFSDLDTRPPSEQQKLALQQAELCVVEIATLDQLTACGYYYHFPSVGTDFVRGQGRAHQKWWRDVTDRRTRAAAPETVEAVLAARRERGQDTGELVERFVTDMRMETLDEGQLQGALEGLLQAGAGKKFLFVPHLNIATSGPDVMAERWELKEMLTRVAGRLGQEIFDPAPFVEAFGFRRALKGEGADKYHYEKEFRPVLGQALLAAIRQRMLGSN